MRVLMLYVLIVIGLVSCEAQSDGSKSVDNKVGPIARDLQVQEFKKLYESKSGAILLDVRTPSETAEGIIANALEGDISSAAFEKQISALDKSKPVFVYCRSGGRSGRAMSIMKQKGFQEVYNLAGGIGAWQQAGFPVINK
jgi:rhodanese-related sulfurtransferase